MAAPPGSQLPPPSVLTTAMVDPVQKLFLSIDGGGAAGAGRVGRARDGCRVPTWAVTWAWAAVSYGPSDDVASVSFSERTESHTGSEKEQSLIRFRF